MLLHICSSLAILHSGSRRQLVNGVVLLATFFGVRLIYGNLIALDFFQTLSGPGPRALLPAYYPEIYKTAMATLSGLNLFWFYKMVKSVVKRFTGPEVGAKGNKRKA